MLCGCEHPTSTPAKIKIKIRVRYFTTGNFWIKWSWDNPDTDDFSHVMAYIDGNWKTNTSKNHYKFSTEPHQSHRISIQTVDASRNKNDTWVNLSATVPNNRPVVDVEDKVIARGKTLFVDVDASDADGDGLSYSCNRTDLFSDFDGSSGGG